MLAALPEQIGFASEVTVRVALIDPATFIVTVLVSCAGVQPPAVASTLNVVVAVSAPVDKFIVLPVPVTGVPILTFPMLFRS